MNETINERQNFASRERWAVHDIAIMSGREGLEFETEIASDTAALNTLVDPMLATKIDIYVFRDPTRGGIASALTEIAQSAKVGMLLDEARIPISEEVKGACEILGPDPVCCKRRKASRHCRRARCRSCPERHEIAKDFYVSVFVLAFHLPIKRFFAG